MTTTAELAAFAAEVTYDGLPDDTREALKRRVLDAVGVGLGSIDADGTEPIRRAITDRESAGPSRLWGTDWTAPPADAAAYNAALVASGNVDAFLSPSVVRPGTVVAAVLAAGEASTATGRDLIAGLAAAYEIRGELAWNAPTGGFQAATGDGLAAAAGVGRVMGFDADRLRGAVGLAGMRATLPVGSEATATSTAIREAMVACELADAGLSAPDPLADPGGWTDRWGAFDIDLDSGCDRVHDTAVLPYYAHPHAQSAIGATIELAERAPIDPADVDSIRVDTFEAAAAVVDPVAIAAALVDRSVTTRPTARADLRPLAESVDVAADTDFQRRFDDGEIPARVTVTCRDGTRHLEETRWFDGHPATPASWGLLEDKFAASTADHYDAPERREVIETVRGLEAETAAELSRLLE